MTRRWEKRRQEVRREEVTRRDSPLLATGIFPSQEKDGDAEWWKKRGGEEEMREAAKKLQRLRTSYARFLRDDEEMGKEKRRSKERRR